MEKRGPATATAAAGVAEGPALEVPCLLHASRTPGPPCHLLLWRRRRTRPRRGTATATRERRGRASRRLSATPGRRRSREEEVEIKTFGILGCSFSFLFLI